MSILTHSDKMVTRKSNNLYTLKQKKYFIYWLRVLVISLLSHLKVQIRKSINCTAHTARPRRKWVTLSG